MVTKTKSFPAIMIAVVAFLLIASTNVSATPVDFRDYSEGSGPAGHGMFYATTIGGDLYWDSTDGYGVIGGEQDDEIDGTESLIITFSVPVTRLDQIFITDLFNEHNTTEAGTFSINGGSPLGIFYAVQELDGINNGELTLNLTSLNLTDVSSIEFMVPRDMFGTIPSGFEFSVSGVDVIANPEPSAIILLGSGLIGLAAFTRKFKKK